MSIEEGVDLHDQWLRSVESNLDRAAADIATLAKTQSTFMNWFTQALAQLTTRVDTLTATVQGLAEAHQKLAEEHRQIAEEHRDLERMFKDYIRSLRDGGQKN